MANVISGWVQVKENGQPVPGLVVVVHDVDPDTRPEEAIPDLPGPPPASASRDAALGDRLGARVTNAAGAFELQFEDDEFRVRNPTEKRPDLLLEVLAPEEPGATPESRLLYRSPEIRQNAGKREEYLIRIPAAVLQKAGLPVPVDPAVAKDPPQKVVAVLDQAVGYRVQLETEGKRIASEQVAARRVQAAQLDQVVRDRVVRSLTGLDPAEADRLNVVLPGADARPMIQRTYAQGIARSNARGALAGYIVVSPDEAAGLKDAAGHYRTDLTPAEVEPFLFGPRAGGGATATRVRQDPAVRASRAASTPTDPFAAAAAGGTGNGTGNGHAPGDGAAGGAEPGGPITVDDLPRLLGNLVQPILAPEQASIFAPQTRPDAGAVQSAVGALSLRSGPADVDSFYDFHQLQIAFDFVWQQAVDQGIIDTAQELARQLDRGGGDPAGALAAGGNPVEALRAEARHVRAAAPTLQAAGVAYRMAAGGPDGGAGPGDGPPPTPPTPPPARPPALNHTLLDGIRASVSGAFALPPAPEDLIQQLDDMLGEPYKFQVFAPGSVNFGLLVTYREHLQPKDYQAGRLVKTLTLAPKESRKITTRRVVKRERAVKETQENQRIRKDESDVTMRDEAEIVQKAMDKTTFALSAKGSFDIGIGSGDVSTSYGRDAEKSSQDAKKSFREAVVKAAQEFKDERKVEVETKESVEQETGETTEIVNPNDELTVTYLFYELQRRYRLTETLHRLTPVVLVGLEVPGPDRASIDRVLLTHSWILNRVLLDDRYRPALDYLSSQIVGKELELQQLAAKVADARAAVATMQALYRDISSRLTQRERDLEAAMQRRADKIGGEETHWYSAILGDGDQNDREALQLQEDAAKDAYERAVKEEQDLRMRLDAETAALSNAVDAHAKAYGEHATHLLEVAALRVHFKENLLYYMQAIWSYRYEDQTFFSLSNVKVPRLRATQRTYAVSVPDEPPLGVVSGPGRIVLRVDVDVQLDPAVDPAQDFDPLPAVADLGQPLGVKGNLLILPLRESNALTDFMMVPYVDGDLGLRDPDDLGSWTPEAFAQYARDVAQQAEATLSPADLAALKADLEARYRRILSSPRLTDDEVTIPTSSLFLEALPGVHPLLEDFKLAHRIVDVKKAQAEARKLEIENLRYAARILGKALEDPEIDKKIIVTGPEGVVVNPGDA